MPKKKKTKLSSLKFVKKREEFQGMITLPKIFYSSLVICLLVIISVYIFRNRLPPELPLYYGLPKGVPQLAGKNYLILPSSIALMFILINLSLSLLIKDNFLKKSLIITGFTLSIFSAVTTIKIMLLVGNF